MRVERGFAGSRNVDENTRIMDPPASHRSLIGDQNVEMTSPGDEFSTVEGRAFPLRRLHRITTRYYTTI